MKPGATDRALRIKEELFGDEYNVPTVALALHLHPMTVSRYCREGVFKGVYKMGREWYIPKASIIQWRDEQLEAAHAKQREKYGPIRSVS